MANPTGKGGFSKGQSGNPGGRSDRRIADISRMARQYAHLALSTLVEVCRSGMERNRLVAARELLDRGYGRPAQMIDHAIITKKLSDLTPDELEALEARLISASTDDALEDAVQCELTLQ